MNDPSATPAPPAPELACPGAPALPAQVTVIATIQSVITDLADLLTSPGDDASARVLDRLSEEVAEAAAMLRALPARPAGMSGHDYQALAALRTAHAAGEDIGETIARALARLAAGLGGSAAALANRPGSGEAALVADLLSGTVGPDDEHLSRWVTS